MNKSFDVLKINTFSLIGKEGKNDDMEHLWNEAENHIREVKDHIKMDSFGPSYYGINGDETYFAGFEMKDNVKATGDWKRIEVGGGEYLVHYLLSGQEFPDGIAEMKKEAFNMKRELLGFPIDHMEEGVYALYWLLG